MRVKISEQGNNSSSCWGGNSRLTEYESDAYTTASHRSQRPYQSYHVLIMHLFIGDWFVVQALL